MNVLGIGVSVITPPQALEFILDALESRSRGYISVTSVHGIMEGQADETFRDILNGSFLCVPDGMPLCWMGRLRGHSSIGRVYGPDLMRDVCRASVPRGFRHFFYGGKPGVAARLRERLVNQFPGLKVVGVFEPPFRPLNPLEEKELRAQLEATRPDMLWVGLSTPKQEAFMAKYRPMLDVPLMAGVGAAFDIHAGLARQAPAWIRNAGFEWLFRLCHEPGRLWRRNLNNFGFLPLAACQLSGLRTYGPPGSSSQRSKPVIQVELVCDSRSKLSLALTRSPHR